MKPWCAEEDVPTAANLVLYREWRSCVGWHRDDLPLLGECGDAKLIVPVSLGSSAVFRWRRQSCPDDEGHLCWLRHGDVLVMDGQCQDEFLHCTNCGLDQERINITFRWIKQHVASRVLLANVCAGSIRPCYGVGGERRVLGILGAPCDSVCMEVLAFAGLYPHVHRIRGDTHPFWAEVGGGIFCVTPSEFTGLHKKCALFVQGHGSDSICVMPCMLASVGQPSLHGYDACMVYGITGELRGNCQLNLRTVPPETNSNDFGVFRNYSADSNSNFRRCDFFLNDSIFLVCSKFNHMQRDCPCTCALACSHPHNSISNVAVSLTIHDHVEIFIKKRKPLRKVKGFFNRTTWKVSDV